MSRRLTVVLVIVAGAAITVFLVARTTTRPKPETGQAATGPSKRPPRLWTATTASERAAPADCAPLAGGGFTCGACRDDSSCPPGQYCAVNLEGGRTECKGSECARGEDCPRPLLCRVVTRTSRGDPIRGCVESGLRPAGAACDPDNAGDPAVSCSRSLLCVQGGCAPACVENEFPERNACAGEVPCVKTDNGWGCVPSCKHATGGSCPSGKVCEYLSVEDPTALCVHKVGANCLGSKGGCPSDHDCVVETDARAERTTFACAMKCNPNTPACPAGSVCVPGKSNGHCRRACAAGQDRACTDGEHCRKALTAGELWYCSAA